MTPQELLELEKRLREADCQALEGYRKGLNEAPILYKPGFIKAASGGKGEPMIFVASEESEDRMGDVICCAGWDLSNFKKNPVYMFMHNYALPPVGRVPKVWTEGKQLLNTVEWDGADPMAQQLQRKYAEGFMRAESVGFRPMEFKDAGNASGGYRFEKQELLEISAVPIPAHPAALAKMLMPTTLTFIMPGLPEAVKAPITEAPPLKGVKEMPEKTEKKDMAEVMGQMREHMAAMAALMDDMEGMMGEEEGQPEPKKSGGDLPQTKAGAVLNRTNKGRLNQAKELIDQVLESAGKPEAEEEEPKGLSSNETAAIGEAIRLLGQAAK